MSVREINPEEFQINPFTTYAKEWTLITAGNETEGVNTMTASWGQLGHVWNKNTIIVYVRPQRYTKQFVDANEYFSVSVFPEEYHDKLLYLGRTSGKDENKIEKAGLTTEFYEGVPYFKEAKLTFIARKIYEDELKDEKFHDKELRDLVYPEKDYHTAYIGELVKILES